jgi:hypothetical protein
MEKVIGRPRVDQAQADLQPDEGEEKRSDTKETGRPPFRPATPA